MADESYGFRGDLNATMRSMEVERRRHAHDQEQQRIRVEQAWQEEDGERRRLQPLVVRQLVSEAKDFAGVMREHSRRPDARIPNRRRLSVQSRPTRKRAGRKHPVWMLGFATVGVLIYSPTRSDIKYGNTSIIHDVYARGLSVDASGRLWEVEARQRMDPYLLTARVLHSPAAVSLAAVLLYVTEGGAAQGAGTSAVYLGPLETVDSKRSNYLRAGTSPLPSGFVAVGQPEAELVAPRASIVPGYASVEHQPVVQAFRERYFEIAMSGRSMPTPYP